jgi:hypothetical protein
MDHDHRTADTGMLGSETENPDPAAIPRAPSRASRHDQGTATRSPPPTCPTSTPTAPASAPDGLATLNRDHAWPEGRDLPYLTVIPTMTCSASWNRSPSSCWTGICRWPGLNAHDYMPWSMGRDFDNEPWTPHQLRLTGVAQAAFEVNLVT